MSSKFSFGSLLVKAGLAEDVKVQEESIASPAPVQAAPASNLGVVGSSSSEELAVAIITNVKTNLGGNQYFKLLDSIETMKAAKLDEVAATKGSAALMGASAVTIVAAIDEVITAVKNEQSLFESGDFILATKHAEELNATVAAREQEINALLEKVKELSEEKVKLAEESSSVSSSAANMRATFSATVGKLVTGYEAEKTKLQTYLG